MKKTTSIGEKHHHHQHVNGSSIVQKEHHHQHEKNNSIENQTKIITFAIKRSMRKK
jgi:hypothetical protein